MKVPIAQGELLRHLAEQIGFLRASSKAFDDGADHEAVRLAVVVRVLVHQTSASHALLVQLGIRDALAFLDTAVQQGLTTTRNPDGSIEMTQTMAPGGMAALEFSEGAFRFVAPLGGEGLVHPRVPFADWWAGVLVPASLDFTPGARQYAAITRKDLVLAMANQDGGAHVDPDIDDVYAAFRAHDHGVPFTVAGAEPIRGNAARVSMRQIAYEALQTLAEAGYE